MMSGWTGYAPGVVFGVGAVEEGMLESTPTVSWGTLDVISGNRGGRDGMVLGDVCDRWATLEVILGRQGWERGDGAGCCL